MAQWFLLVFIRLLKGMFFPVGALSEWENYLHSFQREEERNKITEPGNKKERKKQTYGTTALRGFLWFVNRLVSRGEGWRELLHSQPREIVSVHSYLILSFCSSLQQSSSCVMLDGYKFKKRAGGRKRNERIIDLQRLYRLLSHPCC